MKSSRNCKARKGSPQTLRAVLILLFEALSTLRLDQTHLFRGQQKDAIPGPDTLWLHFVPTSLKGAGCQELGLARITSLPRAQSLTPRQTAAGLTQPQAHRMR